MIRFLIVLSLMLGGAAQAKPRSVVYGGPPKPNKTAVLPHTTVLIKASYKTNTSSVAYNELKSLPIDSLTDDITRMPKELQLQTLCLAMAIYREARGEAYKDRLIVAQISIKRVGLPDFAPTLCEVIYQVDVQGGHRIAQYSWTIKPIRHQIKEPTAWIESQKLAYTVLSQNIMIPICPYLYFNKCRMLSNKMRDVK